MRVGFTSHPTRFSRGLLRRGALPWLALLCLAAWLPALTYVDHLPTLAFLSPAPQHVHGLDEHSVSPAAAEAPLVVAAHADHGHGGGALGAAPILAPAPIDLPPLPAPMPTADLTHETEPTAVSAAPIAPPPR